MRLPRPYVPLSVRVQVAERQVRQRCVQWRGILYGLSEPMPLALRLRRLLLALGIEEPHLDHDPALAARKKIWHAGRVSRYDPDANDPDFLIYREAAAHRVKTNVKGDGAQYPDRVLIKRQRRLERLIRPRTKRKIASRSFAKTKMKIASRPFRRSKR